MKELEQIHFYELLLKLVEGSMTPNEKEVLESLLISSPEAAARYNEFMCSYVWMLKKNQIQTSAQNALDSIMQQSLWSSLAEQEKYAPAIEIPKQEQKHEPLQKVVYKKTPRQINKFALFTAVLSSAALLCIIILLKLTPDRFDSQEVAVLKDVYNARWANSSLSLEQEDRLYTNKVFSLSKGLVEIQMDSGVDLTMEGPAEFEFSGQDNLELNYGRVYARVSPRGIGFTVSTENCRIIDLGTEFGVFRDFNGQTELHVMKGQTTLVSGGSWLAKKSQAILQKHARQISADGTQVQQIPLAEGVFVRSIDSQTGTVWRGQQQIDLADIVGWGNGFGTGKPDTGIDPGTGKAMILTLSLAGRHPQTSPAYRSVPSNPFVDGVFVPDSQAGQQVISSAGHTFTDFPVTGGNYYLGILNGTSQDFTGYQDYPEYGGPGIALDGVVYGTRENPAIFIHSSQGITFDLGAIRGSLDEAQIASFTSVCGISQTAPDFEEDMANLYVLVDGQVRFRLENIHRGESFPMEITLNPSDRFLTLMSTVSSQSSLSQDLPNVGDWCMFGKPVLTLNLR